MLGTIRSVAMRFRHDRTGVALPEFVVLFGLLLAGVLIASILFSNGGDTGLSLWGKWINDVRAGFSVTHSE
ncbi:MAG: hypothetical protein AAFQ90_11440 [Pseudomonadota bacterium]